MNNLIKLHYFTIDGEHFIDAANENKCSTEFLHFANIIAETFDCELKIEAFAINEGGFERVWNVICKNENKKAVITSTIIGTVIASVLASGITGGCNRILDYITADKELTDLQKEDLRLSIELKRQALSENTRLIKRQSNFYENVSKDERINAIELSSLPEYGEPFSPPRVTRNDFSNFILTSNELEPVTIENAIIEIISPVIQKGNYQVWRGRYEGNIIKFRMLSSEFMIKVYGGEIEFKNGFTVNCNLLQFRRMNEVGEAYIYKQDVTLVHSYYVNDNLVETNEGRRYRQKKEIDNAPNLFTGIEDI